MNKKANMKPAMQVVKVGMTQIICESRGRSISTMGLDPEDELYISETPAGLDLKER